MSPTLIDSSPKGMEGDQIFDDLGVASTLRETRYND